MLRFAAEQMVFSFKKMGIKRGSIGKPSTEFRDWVAMLPVPAELKRFLLTYSLRENHDLASGGVWYGERSLMNAHQRLPLLMNAGLIAVGAAPNGDKIAIDFITGNGNAGYISHEEIFSNSARDVFIVTSPSIGTMIYGLQQGTNYPIDYYDAKEKA